MNEEVKIKISQPMFEVGELERFDNNIHSIVEEYSKLMFKEKDQILTQRIIMKQEEEIKRLNNIIKEVREYIQDRYDGEALTHTFDKDNVKDLLEILDKENVKAIPPEVIGTNGEDGGLFDYGDKGE